MNNLQVIETAVCAKWTYAYRGDCIISETNYLTPMIFCI